MKLNAFKFRILLIFLILASVSVKSQSFTKEDQIVRTFALADDTEVEITNKYGDITIESWDVDSVKIEIVYKVTSAKKSMLSMIYDAINFDFKANEYYVYVKTNFEGRSSFWFDVSDIANNLFTAGTQTSIDYTIYIPAKNHLSLNLKYGNVYMANYTGHFELLLSNGDFKAHNLTGENELEIEFGDATINRISDGKVSVSYGTIEIEDAEELSLIGQSSEINFGKINNFTIDSKRDKISIEEVSSISGTTYFSRLTVDEIVSMLDISSRYGSVKLKEIGAEVSNIKLMSYNTSVNLYLQQNKHYFISLISDDKADVTYSADLGEFTIKELPGKKKLMQAECLIGDKAIAIPIIIDIKSGLLTFKLQD